MAECIRLSIVTPVFNTPAKYLESLSQSLAPSAGDVPYEWLLVDDASSDPETLAALERLSRAANVHLIPNEAGKGAAAARNHGASKASGPRLMFVDADDLLQPGAVQHLLGMMDEHPEIRWLAGDYQQFHGEMPPMASEPVGALDLEHWPDAASRLVFETLFNQGSYLLDRSLFFEVGGFDERFAIGEDWLMWMRLAVRGELYHCPLLVFWQRRGHDSVMSGSLNLTSAVVAPYITAWKEPRFRRQKRTLRWRIFRLYRLLSERNQAVGRRGEAAKFALLAAVWAVNELGQWVNVLRAFVGARLR